MSFQTRATGELKNLDAYLKDGDADVGFNWKVAIFLASAAIYALLEIADAVRWAARNH